MIICMIVDVACVLVNYHVTDNNLGSCIFWGARFEISTDVSVDMSVVTRSTLMIDIKVDLESTNCWWTSADVGRHMDHDIIGSLLVKYMWHYQSTVGPVPVDSQPLAIWYRLSTINQWTYITDMVSTHLCYLVDCRPTSHQYISDHYLFNTWSGNNQY